MMPLSRLSRRDVLIGSSVAAALALAPAFAWAQAKVDLTELYGKEALPDIVIGKADAPVTIIEYASMTCTHCAAFHTETYPTLQKDYIDTGKVKFVLREFPLDALAAAAFMLARCAGDKRTAMVDLLFTQQRGWAFVDKPLDALESMVKQAGISSDAFKTCLDDKELYKNVLAVRQRASEKFAIDSTPTFFVNGVRKTGEISPADLAKLIASAPPAK
jgi:protein-disulfide isomerase